MRDIKFRALTNNNLMVYGYYFYDENSRLHYIITRKGVLWQIQPETLGQFTETFDKCQKPIYEGDIDETKFIVTYCNGQNEFKGMTVGWYLQRDNFVSWFELAGDINIFIIGNIHEKQEEQPNTSAQQ